MAEEARGGWWVPPRADREELIDSFEHPERDFRASFRDIRRINRLFGGTSVVLRRMRELLEEGRGPVSVLDVATGSADIPTALLAWARRRGVTMSVVALDANPKVLRYAQSEAARELGLRLVKGDALALPFASGAFDYVTSSLTFHHFDEDTAARALREMHRVARRGVLVNDLQRAYLPAWLIWFVTRIAWMHPLTRHDAPLSVMRARTVPEYRELARRAGLPGAAVYRHPFWRAALVVRKEA